MRTPPRILRSRADDLNPLGADLTTPEIERRDKILKTAEDLFFRFGRNTITFTAMALALRLSPATLRRVFLDLDCLLADILRRHLLEVANAMGKVPRDAPNLHALRRAAYVAATRLPFGGLTQAHVLLTRDRNLLPEDLRESIDGLRDSIAVILSPTNARATMDLLDLPCFEAAQIEAMLAAAAQTPTLQALTLQTLTLQTATLQTPTLQTPSPQDEPIETPKPPSRPILVATTPAPQAAAPANAVAAFYERHPDDVYDYPGLRAAAALNARGQPPPPS